MTVEAKSKSARTYLERNLDKFLDSSYEEIISHGLNALRECLPNEQELNTKNCTIAVVGKDKELTVLNNDDVAPFLALIDQTKRTKKSEDESMETTQDSQTPAPTESTPDEQMET